MIRSHMGKQQPTSHYDGANACHMRSIPAALYSLTYASERGTLLSFPSSAFENASLLSLGRLGSVCPYCVRSYGVADTVNVPRMAILSKVHIIPR